MLAPIAGPEPVQTDDSALRLALDHAFDEAPSGPRRHTQAVVVVHSRIVRDLAGGDAGSTLAFVHRELFDKLGMQHATLEFDAAGTPIGSSHVWAPARDWARLGLLYLNDGVVGGARLLPPGWVDYSARQTPGRAARPGVDHARRQGYGGPADARADPGTAEPLNRPYLNALRARSAWARASARGKSLRSLSIVSGFIQ